MPRGSKNCAKCGHTTGPRAHVCPKCQTPFSFKEKTAHKLNTDSVETPKAAFVTPKIYAFGKMPQNKEDLFPIKPVGNNEKHIREWLSRMADFRYMLNGQNYILARSAILQAAKSFWQPQTPLGKLAERIIKENLARGF